MGRSERSLDPSDGPVHQFASELRTLRQEAGLNYREMALIAQYAPSVLSRAADGRALPSLNVTLAYVTACGGDVRAWEERWRALAAFQAEATSKASSFDVPPPSPAILASGHPSQAAATERQPDPPSPRPDEERPVRTSEAGRRTLRVAQPLPNLLTPAVLATLVGVLLLSYARPGVTSTLSGVPAHVHSVTVPTPPTAYPAVPVSHRPPRDGADPVAAGCVADATTIAATPIRLTGPKIVGRHDFAAGTAIGDVELRYSPRCNAAWGRVLPAAFIPNWQPGGVKISVSRPSDHDGSEFHVSHIVQAWGNILLMGKGCVRALATITIGTGRGASAQTTCLRR